MDFYSHHDRAPIVYHMLNNFERGILSMRPVNRDELFRLYKHTLVRFIVGNGGPAHNQEAKTALVDRAIDLITGEEEEMQQATGHQLWKPPAGEPLSFGGIGYFHVASASEAYPPAVQAPTMVSRPSTAPASTALYYAPPGPALTDAYPPAPLKMTYPTTTPASTTSQPAAIPPTTHNPTTVNHSPSGPCECHCHECLDAEPPLPYPDEDVLEDPRDMFSGDPLSLYHTDEEDEDEEEEESHGPEGIIMHPCNALLNLEDWSDNEDLEEFIPALECSCAVPIEQLLENTQLNETCKSTFTSLAESSVGELVHFLEAFGSEVPSSGCRIHLLMLLRDMLEEQVNVLQTSSAGNTTSASGGAAPPAARTTGASGGQAPAAGLNMTTSVWAGSALGVSSRMANARRLTALTQDFARLMTESQNLPAVPASTEGAAAKGAASGGSKEEEEEEEKTDTERECVICLQSTRDIAFVPCGHTLCCAACSRRVRECPVCRKRIQKRLKIFFS